jgi:hypothetical protein
MNRVEHDPEQHTNTTYTLSRANKKEKERKYIN